MKAQLFWCVFLCSSFARASLRAGQGDLKSKKRTHKCCQPGKMVRIDETPEIAYYSTFDPCGGWGDSSSFCCSPAIHVPEPPTVRMPFPAGAVFGHQALLKELLECYISDDFFDARGVCLDLDFGGTVYDEEVSDRMALFIEKHCNGEKTPRGLDKVFAQWTHAQPELLQPNSPMLQDLGRYSRAKNPILGCVLRLQLNTLSEFVNVLIDGGIDKASLGATMAECLVAYHGHRNLDWIKFAGVLAALLHRGILRLAHIRPLCDGLVCIIEILLEYVALAGDEDLYAALVYYIPSRKMVLADSHHMGARPSSWRGSGNEDFREAVETCIRKWGERIKNYAQMDRMLALNCVSPL